MFFISANVLCANIFRKSTKKTECVDHELDVKMDFIQNKSLKVISIYKLGEPFLKTHLIKELV